MGDYLTDYKSKNSNVKIELDLKIMQPKKI